MPLARKVGILLFGTLVIGLSLLVMGGLNPPATHADHNSAAGAPHGTTDGWFRGKTVTFFYNKPFFCAQPPTSGASSGCEVGADAKLVPRPGPIPTLYVLVPLGFSPDPATLQCPVAGNCINHPQTIDLSRIFGPSAANVLLPPHSHVVDESHGGWWKIEVIGVTDLAAWNRIAAAKSLEAVRAEQAAGKATPDIGTNLFLFFQVQAGRP
ncbi:MAG: hypothetical protein C4315_12330 [Chloroflexota bacterium]